MDVDLEELAQFLVRAKTRTYAAGGKEVAPQRSGFKELEYGEDCWNYRDSYAGFFFAQGQEVVRYNGIPIWAMAYSGGLLPEYRDMDFAEKTFAFLKKALLLVDESRPFRGPTSLKGKWDFEYIGHTDGDIRNFTGRERILYQGEEVFRQDYAGGVILYDPTR